MQNLDPCKSYIVFENRYAPGHDAILDPERGILGALEHEGMNFEQVRDMDAGREYLVVEANPGNEEQILGKLLGLGFPENSAYYVYKAYEV